MFHYVTKPCDVGHMTGFFFHFNNWLGTLKTKSGGGMCWVGDFVLSGPNPFLKSDQIVMCPTSHG